MKGYVTRKGDRWYAVIYEGIDPSPAGNDAAGTPPAPSALTPSGLPHDWRRRPTVATTPYVR